jgi:hypothetical protein
LTGFFLHIAHHWDIIYTWLIGGMVYTGDLKSPARMGLRVRIPHQLPFFYICYYFNISIGGNKMDFGIGDIVKHLEAGTVGIVQMIDGVAVWVRWGCGSVNHANCMQLEILDKSACV